MNREVHVRFWESPEVKVLRATRHEQRIRTNASAAGRPQTADPASGQGGFRLATRDRALSNGRAD